MRATDVVFDWKRAFCVRLRKCGQGLFFPLRGSVLECFICRSVTHLRPLPTRIGGFQVASH